MILTFLWDSSPWIDRTKLAKKTPIKYTARDGLIIHGYLTIPLGTSGKNLPMVVHPHGGPNVRDTMRYDTYVQFLASRGYAVFQPNFRGSTGYGAYHYISANKQFGKTMQDDITDGVNYLIDQGVADPDRIAIFGGSYGGYATMAGLTFTPDLYAAGINFVGVVDLELLQEDSNRNSRRFGGFYDELRLEWEAERAAAEAASVDPHGQAALDELFERSEVAFRGVIVAGQAGMNVVGALIGIDCFKIHAMSDDMIFIADSVASVNIS